MTYLSDSYIEHQACTHFGVSVETTEKRDVHGGGVQGSVQKKVRQGVTSSPLTWLFLLIRDGFAQILVQHSSGRDHGE